MSEINIWLDDIRPAPDGFIWVKDVNEVVCLFLHHQNLDKMKCDINIISLDNDLGENKEEGYKVLDEIEEIYKNNIGIFLPNEIRVHSANPVARKRMQTVIDNLYRKSYARWY